MRNFQINSNLLRAMLSGVEHAHAVKDIRSYINGIRFEVPNNNTLHLIATDGHRLAHAECTLSVERDYSTPIAFTVQHTFVKHLIAILKEAKDNLVDVCYVPDMGYVSVGMGGRSLGTALVNDEKNGKYPEWRRVIPKPETQPQHYAPSTRTDGEAFNPLYLADAMKGINAAGKAMGTTWPQARILLIGGEARLGHQTALIRYSGNGFEMECVVMGTRGA